MNDNKKILKDKYKKIFWISFSILEISFLIFVDIKAGKIFFFDELFKNLLLHGIMLVLFLLIAECIATAKTRKEHELVSQDLYKEVIKLYSKNFKNVKGDKNGAKFNPLNEISWYKNSYTLSSSYLISGVEDKHKFTAYNIDVSKSGIDSQGTDYIATAFYGRWLTIQTLDRIYEPVLIMNKKFKKISSFRYYENEFNTMNSPLSGVYIYSSDNEEEQIELSDELIRYIEKYCGKKAFAVIFANKEAHIIRYKQNLMNNLIPQNLEFIEDESAFIKETIEVFKHIEK